MLRTLLVMMVLVPGFVMALRDRFIALLLYLWFAFFRPQDWIWVDITGLRLSLVLGLVLLVPSISSGLWPNLSHPLSIGSVLFLLLAFVAQINAINQAIGWLWIDFMVKLILVCLMAVTLVTTPQRLIRVMAVVGGSLAFYAAKAGVVSLLVGGVRFADGLTGAFTDNNGYALGTVMIMPLLLAVGLNANLLFDDENGRLTRWARRGFLVSVPLCAFTVVSTFSRGGFLALAAASLVYVALHQKRIRLSLAGVAVVLLILTFAPIPDGYFDRLETIRTYEEIGEDSAISRPHFWRVAVQMAAKQPLGIGLRNYESVYDDYDFSSGRYGQGRAVHSSHFQVLAELGYLGLAVWLGQFALAFLTALRVRRRSRTPGLPPSSAKFLLSVSNCLITSMTGFIIGGSFLSLAFNDVTWLTFAILASLDRLSSAMVKQPAVVPGAGALAVPTGIPNPTTMPQWKPWRPAPVAARFRETDS